MPELTLDTLNTGLDSLLKESLVPEEALQIIEHKIAGLRKDLVIAITARDALEETLKGKTPKPSADLKRSGSIYIGDYVYEVDEFPEEAQEDLTALLFTNERIKALVAELAMFETAKDKYEGK